MATKQRKRKHSRKEQSNRDKDRVLMSDTTYSEPLREYNSFLDHLKSHGYARDEFTRIPLNLIDLAAAIIASMITGNELSLFGTHVHAGHGYDDHQDRRSKDHGRDQQQQQQQQQQQPEDNVFHFIQRILKRTQLSCTSLILALVYIDRFKARLARNLKRRTRLDQGLDYDHRSYTSSIMTWKPHRSVELFTGSNLSSEPSSTVTSPYSINSSSSSPSSSSSSPTYTQSSSTTEEPWSSITLFLVAVICADKYLFDATYSNAEWADFTKGQYTTQMLNDLERRFLGQLQYKLYVSEPEFDGFLSYLEVVLALKQVWGRGLVTFSYSDVRILTQRLMPAYADRLHFRTLQGDMMSIVWQVMATLSRVYLTIVGTIMIAAASYATVMELSALGTRAVMDSVAPSLHGPPHGGSFSSILPLLTNEAMAMQPLKCAFEWNVEGGTHGMAAATGGGRYREQGYDEESNQSMMGRILARSQFVQYIDCH